MTKVIKLDLSLPTQDGFIKLPNKINKYPWKIKDSTITLIMAGHVLERISREQNGFIKFMDECWRVLKIGGQMMVVVNYAGSTAFWSDPTHVNGLTAQTWHHFDPISPMYQKYRPRPWSVKHCSWQANGIMEVLLVKRDLKDAKK